MSTLLKPREAAKRLQVSERTLWANTVPRGDIPAIRIGHCVRYSEEALAEFTAKQTGTTQQEEN